MEEPALVILDYPKYVKEFLSYIGSKFMFNY